MSIETARDRLYKQDSNSNPINHEYYHPTDDCLHYVVNNSAYGKQDQWRRLYTVSPEAIKWDLGESYQCKPGYVTMAMGRDSGGWCYIELKKTTEETVYHNRTGYCGFRGMCMFNIDPMCGPEDRATRVMIFPNHFQRKA